MKRHTLFLQIAVKRESLLPALTLALGVGPLLNLINQYHVLLKLQLNHIDWMKLILTFLVPFFVSLYSATSTKMKFRPGDISPVETVVTCAHCGREQQLYKNRLIPYCPHCREKTVWKVKEFL